MSVAKQGQVGISVAGDGPSYRTADIRFAAFLRVKRAPLIEAVPDTQRGDRFTEFVFRLSQEEASSLFEIYHNPCPDRMVDAYELLECYEGLRTLRHKYPRSC